MTTPMQPMSLLNQPFVLLRRTPRAPLNHCIERLWLASGRGRVRRFEKVLPAGTAQLVIRLHQDPIQLFDDDGQLQGKQQLGVMRGATSRPAIVETQPKSSVVGIHFRPAGPSLFFRDPLNWLTNLRASPEDVWGPGLRSLRDQLLEQTSPDAIFDAVEVALLRRMICPSPQFKAVLMAADQFAADPRTARVKETVQRTGYSPKQFIKLFEQHVGLTPKLFCRLLRFQSALDQINGQAAIDWAKTAADRGYYDQSHLIRDFREFAGMTPSEYRPVARDRKNHVAFG
jgi:AraC-like DNA-binding protein